MNYLQKNWKAIIVGLWIVFSAWFILNSMWNSFQVNVMQNYYVQGQNDIINQLLVKANDKACQPFNIHSQTDKADLVNVACLQKPAAADSTASKK